jgi:hypothetical protein
VFKDSPPNRQSPACLAGKVRNARDGSTSAAGDFRLDKAAARLQLLAAPLTQVSDTLIASPQQGHIRALVVFGRESSAGSGGAIIWAEMTPTIRRRTSRSA